MNTRNASNVDYEMAQWHKLYKSIEENVRREILMDVNDKMNKLKRKNRKLKDQNKCLMEMMSMMRVQPAASRFVPHTPSGLCTPVPEPVLVASKEPVIKEPPAEVASKEPAAVKVIHVKMEKVSTKNNITIDLCDNIQNEVVLKKELVAPPVVVIDEQEEFEQPEVEEQEEEEQEEEEEVEEEQEELEQEEVEQVEEQEEVEEEEEEEQEQEEEEVEDVEDEEVEVEQEEEPKQVITTEVSKVVEPAAEEEEEESVEEVFINNKRYYTTNLLNGVIYDIDEEDNPGNEVGKIVDGKPILKAVPPAAVPAAVAEEEEEEEEESVEEWEFEDDKYYVSNTKDGKIYSITKDEEVGDEIGKFVNGKPIFYD
jgi:hypothetical protein